METNNQEYRISFFKPTNPSTTANRNMVLWLLIIWILAVFGFHVLLKIIEEPTPEAALTNYEQVKESVYSGNADANQLKIYAHTSLQVLSKVFVAKDERLELQKSLNWALFNIANEQETLLLKAKIDEFKKIEANTTDILAPDYQQSKIDLMAYSAPILGLEDRDVRTKILPLELSLDYPQTMGSADFVIIESIFEKYLIHNESFLTNTIVLGFPFHYFYSAVFLLVLFILLCWVYCVRTDDLNKKYGIDD